jgi:hypothetical protein
MKIIMLSGDTNKGKSTTFNLVYDSLNPKTIVEPKKLLGNPIYKDFECIIEYEGKRIAFYTMGDFPNYLIEAFEKYKIKCDCLVCACNTNLENIYKRAETYQHTIIDKTVAKSETQEDLDIANKADCDKIIDEIKNSKFMEIIMLSGATDKGKTTTLHMVYDSIDLAPEDIIEPKKLLGNEENDPNDFECIIRYKDKLSIAFYTMGDYSGDLMDAFDRYNTKCDYLICACNTGKKNPYSRIKNYRHTIIDKTVAKSKAQADLDFANNVDCNKIIHEII